MSIVPEFGASTMTLTTTSPILARNEALYLVRAALRRLVARLPEPTPGDPMLEVSRLWDERLEAAARLAPEWPLPETASRALSQMVDGVDALEDQDFIIDWIDLLPMNALKLADVQPTALQTEFASGMATDLTNRATESAWETMRTPLALLSAA